MPDEHHLILRQATENILSAVAPTLQHRIALAGIAVIGFRSIWFIFPLSTVAAVVLAFPALAQTQPSNARELADKCFVGLLTGPGQVNFTLGTFTFGGSRMMTDLDILIKRENKIYDVSIPLAGVACNAVFAMRGGFLQDPEPVNFITNVSTNKLCLLRFKHQTSVIVYVDMEVSLV